MDFTIDRLLETDWPQVRIIYEQGIATGLATFETAPPEWAEWDAAHLPSPRLVARTSADRRDVIGWAALNPVSRRKVYAGVAEVSIYMAESARRRGIGTALLLEIVRQSEAAGFWTLQAGIFPENTASVLVHEKCGFRVVGAREKLGQLRGQWRDVLLLERRSAVVG